MPTGQNFIISGPLLTTIKLENDYNTDLPMEKPKRKRQRLDHLTQDEKLMRR